MNCEIILNWSSGTPELAGLYFVAVKYGESAGEFQFCNWNGEAWELNPEGEVESFIDIQSFKNQMNIKWPKTLHKTNTSVSDPWEEA